MPSSGYILRPRSMLATTSQFTSPIFEGPFLVQAPIQDSNHCHQLQTRKWIDEALAAVLRAVDVGGKIRQVYRLFDISALALSDHISGRTLTWKRGPAGVLTPEEEPQLLQYVMKMVDLGYPLNLRQLKIKVIEMIQDCPISFTNGFMEGLG